MLTKFIPVTLLVLAAVVTTVRAPWPVSVPITGAAAQSLATPVKVSGPVTGPAAVQPARSVAADDYRMNIQDGVTANAYNLVPLAEHDAVRTQSMIDGIAGQRSARGANPAHSDSVDGQATGLLPRPAIAALWLAGLMAVVLMALRRRH